VKAGSPRERAVLLAAASQATAAVDGPVVAAEELRGVLARWAPGDGEEARLVLDTRLALLSSFVFEGAAGSGRHLAQFAGLPGRTPEERTLLALLAQRAFNEGRPAAEVLGLGRRALGEGRLIVDGPATLLPWGLAVVATVGADGVAEGEAELRRARAVLGAGGSPADFALVAAVAAQTAWRTGDLGRCAAEAASSLEALRLREPGPASQGVRAVMTRLTALCALERGDLRAAAGALDDHDRGAPARTVPVTRLHEARAALALARDDPARAREHARSLRDAEAQAGTENPTVPWRVLLALAAERLGDADEARALAADQLALVRRWGAPREVGEALVLDARLHPDRRIASLEEAVAVLDPSPARLALAHALRYLGEALRVERRRTDAREPLQRAAELATACGALALRAHALDAFAALGDTPRKLMFSGVESLTASERRVAGLAAGGMTNRDIARELFVTPKTVENHLGRAYVKLGIGGRRELGAVVTRA
jgi:ATP/maltotriose-dependent transcriptional regulator MalT